LPGSNFDPPMSLWVKTTDFGCSRQVHLTADSDHVADVPARRRCANSDSCGGANIQTNFSAPTTRMIPSRRELPRSKAAAMSVAETPEWISAGAVESGEPRYCQRAIQAITALGFARLTRPCASAL
jgi:hypothetical protein